LKVTVWKKRLLGGGAALALGCAFQAGLAGPVRAQAPGPTTPLQRMAGADHASSTNPDDVATAAEVARRKADAPAASADELLADKGFYMEADTMIRDDAAHLWTARGSVEARYQGRTLRADEVIYNANNGVVTAKGHVQIVNADGTSEFAQAMTLDKGFRTGVAVAFSSHLQENVTIAASEAVRRSLDSVELNKAIFTACNICAKDLTPKEPTWSIQASQVVQDHKKQIIYYRNAVIRVKGIPVMAMPVFWHADPSAPRSSGLLEPKISLDSRLGFSYEQPYLWVISPSQELIVAPEINTKVNPLLEGEYLQRFYSGEVDGRFGYTYEREFDSNAVRYDNLTSRSFILAQGAFAPDQNWVYGFTAERATDPLMFQRYNIANVYQQRGLYATDNFRLISQAYAVEQTARSYVSVSAVSIQGLLPGDLNGTFPLVAPLVEARWEPAQPFLGGTLRLLGDGVLLNRDRSVITDAAPGTSSQRASVSGDWNSNLNLSNGMRFQPFVNGRVDEYNVSNLSPTVTGNYTTTRALGTVGVNYSWPFFKRQGDMTVVLEPIAQVAISPNPQSFPKIPNEDSGVLSFDETNLFDYNKSPGFDYYEEGQRLNYGGRVTLRWDAGASAQFLLGQSLRAETDPSLIGTSLNRTASDVVLAASVQPSTQFSAFTRALVNQNDGGLDRIEVGANVTTAPFLGFFRYLRDNIDTSQVGTRTENITAGAQVLVTEHWGFVTSINRDLVSNVWIREESGIVYQDECAHIELVYQYDGTFDRALRPSGTVLLRVRLATITAAGFQRPDFR
jgi:LPS-assembly protein